MVKPVELLLLPLLLLPGGGNVGPMKGIYGGIGMLAPAGGRGIAFPLSGAYG